MNFDFSCPSVDSLSQSILFLTSSSFLTLSFIAENNTIKAISPIAVRSILFFIALVRCMGCAGAFGTAGRMRRSIAALEMTESEMIWWLSIMAFIMRNVSDGEFDVTVSERILVSSRRVELTVPGKLSMPSFAQTVSISASLSSTYLNDSASPLAVLRLVKTFVETVPLVVTTKVAVDV